MLKLEITFDSRKPKQKDMLLGSLAAEFSLISVSHEFGQNENTRVIAELEVCEK